MLAALVGLIVAFAVIRPGAFATVDNARNVAADASVLMILTLATTFVLITAGIDLSIGSVVVFCQIVSVKTFVAAGGGTDAILLGLVVALAAGGAWGLLNGLLVAKADLPPFIVTLATLAAALGAAQLISDGTDLVGVPLSLITTVGVGSVGGVPWLVLIAAGATLVGGLVLAFTTFGRHTYAVGSNAEAARRAGINVARHLMWIYGLAGVLYGLAAFLSVARFGTTSLGGHANDALNAITAAALGGVSLFGGVGTVFGSVIGVFIPSVLNNGLVIAGVQPFWQLIAVGIALVGAVLLDRVRRRARSRD